MTEKTNEKFYLYWLCSQSGRRYPAGVAFFNESQGDYRLKIDVLDENKMIYLKPVSLTEGVVGYRLEAAVRKEGRIIHRAEIGCGQGKADESMPITMDIGPFSRPLVLEKVA